MTDPVQAIADAVLYEGYVLWPYHRTALKNQQRWTFGGVYPPLWTSLHPDDPDEMVTECLIEGGDDASVAVTVRFLHVVARQVARGEAREPVDELVVGEERHLTWDEAREREIGSGEVPLASLGDGTTLPIAIAGETEAEELGTQGGAPAGALLRTWQPLDGRVELGAERRGPALWMLRVRIVNATPGGQESRDAAQRRTFVSTHTKLTTATGAFVSLTDPPPELAAEAAACENRGTWPVLVGEEGERGTLLSSPIILSDHPRIAPESPGDLFDGGEIDQLLVLNILALTDEEKADMRAADPRTREILERTERLTPEELVRLHGTVRELQAVRR